MQSCTLLTFLLFCLSSASQSNCSRQTAALLEPGAAGGFCLCQCSPVLAPGGLVVCAVNSTTVHGVGLLSL